MSCGKRSVVVAILFGVAALGCSRHGLFDLALVAAFVSGWAASRH